MIITKAWLFPDTLNSEIFPRRYTEFRKDRIDGFGGVLIVEIVSSVLMLA